MSSTLPSTAEKLSSLSKDSEPKYACERCKATTTGRNLIIAFDGTSNKFGDNNTNVIELYNRIIKDDETQLAYYNSGIGTYARPYWRSLTYAKQVIMHKLDLAIAWNFESIILKGYRWLSDHYKPGDQIFLFGFSRGAYQVRVLAGMIATVGLILPGNEEQIPFAYELYADLKHHKPSSGEDSKHGDKAVGMAERFKETFSRKDVMLHFLGVWDTVSSVGITRGKNLPLTEQNGHICYVRHALALDECRVKFLPEYVWGEAASDASNSARHNQPSQQEQNREKRLGFLKRRLSQENEQIEVDIRDEKTSETEVDHSEKQTPISETSALRLKEVWFLGNHSDIGGGGVTNKELNNAAVPVLWMGNEALMAGLKLEPSRVEWDWKKLKDAKPNSMGFIWRFMELIPVRRLTFADPNETCWWPPHMSRGRVIKPGQKIHASVAFAHDGYSPKAKFSKGMKEDLVKDVVGKARKFNVDNTEWMHPIEDILEKDLFDHSTAGDILRRVKEGEVSTDLSGRLRFIASSGEGGNAIIAADKKNLEIVIEMLECELIRVDACEILASLTSHGLTPPSVAQRASIVSRIATMIDDGSEDESISAARLLRTFSSRSGFSLKVDHPLVERLSRMMMSQGTKVRTSAFKVWSVKPMEEEVSIFLKTNDPAIQIAGAWIIAKFAKIENALQAHSEVFPKFVKMLRGEGAAVISSGAYAMSRCTQYESALTELFKPEAVSAISGILHSKDTQQHWGCAELLKAVSDRGKVGILISQRNIVGCIVGMLKTEDEDEAETASVIFKAVATDESSQTMLAQGDDIKNVINLFEMPRVVAPTQDIAPSKDIAPITAATVLVDLAQYQALRGKMRSEGIIDSIARMLDSVGNDEQYRGLRVLKRLAVYTDIRVDIMDKHIFSKIVSKLKRKFVPFVTATAIDVLEELCKDEKFRAVFERKKVVKRIVTIFKKGRSIVKIHAASFVQATSANEELRGEVLSRNIIPTIVEMLKNGPENERLAATDLFTAFAANDQQFANEVFRTTLENESVSISILRMLHSGTSMEQVSVAKMLKAIAKYDKSRKFAIHPMNVLHISMTKLDKHEIAGRRSALKILNAFVEYEDARMELRKEKIVDRVVALLRADHRDTQYKVTELLKNLAVYPEFRIKMSPSEIIPILVDRLDNGNEWEREIARETLCTLSEFDNFREIIPPERQRIAGLIPGVDLWRTR